MARTAANRTRCLENAFSMLKQYGIDWIDIDWEYPGTEREGREEDGANVLALLQKMHAYKAASGINAIASFTPPASFWYLQQSPKIDVLQHYIDWINLMTYDLHGSWDIKFGMGALPRKAPHAAIS
ncbi:hypothetical protein HDU85_002548 [Gaertneriomyces sp. JEL0708]|nr:hypothetical protein HDU85_002548 [Gaertneriomyces sp. JEL0708]